MKSESVLKVYFLYVNQFAASCRLSSQQSATFSQYTNSSAETQFKVISYGLYALETFSYIFLKNFGFLISQFYIKFNAFFSVSLQSMTFKRESLVGNSIGSCVESEVVLSLQTGQYENPNSLNCEHKQITQQVWEHEEQTLGQTVLSQWFEQSSHSMINYYISLLYTTLACLLLLLFIPCTNVFFFRVFKVSFLIGRGRLILQFYIIWIHSVICVYLR